MKTIPKSVTAALTEMRDIREKQEALAQNLAQNVREGHEVLRKSIRGVDFGVREIDISDGYIPGCNGDYMSWNSTLTVSVFKLSNGGPGCNVSASALGKLHTNDNDRGSKDISECLAMIESQKPMRTEEFIAGVREHSMRTWHTDFSYRLFDVTGKEVTEIDYMGSPKSD